MKKAVEKIQGMIYEIRRQKVMFDSDLAVLYQVELRVLNQAVKRNIRRFPDDFMFQLTEEEWKKQRSQFVIFNKDIRKFKPYVFTEQGVAMLAAVLNSQKAIDVNIHIMRAFIQLRNYFLSQSNTAQIEELRKLLLLYINHNDKRVNEIIIALNKLIAQPPEPKPEKKIGFVTN